MRIVKDKLDEHDYDIILAEDLVDHYGDFYDLTLKKAVDRQTRGKHLIWCKYILNMSGPSKRLCEFLGYTEDRVIFHVLGIGGVYTLLDSLPRNPPE